jgi:hypothetical protein
MLDPHSRKWPRRDKPAEKQSRDCPAQWVPGCRRSPRPRSSVVTDQIPWRPDACPSVNMAVLSQLSPEAAKQKYSPAMKRAWRRTQEQDIDHAPGGSQQPVSQRKGRQQIRIGVLAGCHRHNREEKSVSVPARCCNESRRSTYFRGSPQGIRAGLPVRQHKP